MKGKKRKGGEKKKETEKKSRENKELQVGIEPATS